MGTEQTRGLNASQLKYCAALLMLIQHASTALWPLLAPFFQNSLPFYYISRPAFPLFAFFVAEGCHKTHDFQAYLKRLFLFALIAQIPYILALRTWSGSVILTFFLGALSVFCFKRYRTSKTPLVGWGAVLALAYLAHFLGTDYGWEGVLLVFGLYLCGAHRNRQLLTLLVGCIVFYLVDKPFQMLSAHWIPVGVSFWDALPRVLGPYCARYLPFHLISALSALVALLPLYFYNGMRGRGNKWFFYWFYPGHLAILFLMQLLIAA